MIAASTIAPYSLAFYLSAGEIVGSTTASTARASVVAEDDVVRSYAGQPSWEFAGACRAGTAQADTGLIMGSERTEDGLVADLADFLDLDEGWDGEHAAKPSASAVLDATRFVQAAGEWTDRLEATLHVDGSVILEIGDGSEGSLRFKGDGTIIHTARGRKPGAAVFDGYSVPVEVRSALDV